MPGEHSGTMIGQLKGGRSKKATPSGTTSNYFYDPTSGISYNLDNLSTPFSPTSATNPLFGNQIFQGPSNSVTMHTPGQNPVPQTDPVGAYSYGSMSPNDLLNQINSLYSGSTPNFTGEAKNQAASIYKPVLDDLTHQAGTAKKNSQYNDAQLKAMYAALQGSIGADGQQMQKQNAANVSAIKGTGAQEVAAIGKNYGSAASEAAATMAKLGIQAAAPEALPRGAEHEALLQGLANLNTQGSTNLAQQLGTNAQNFNTSQKNIAGFEGTQNRFQNERDLENTLNGLSSQRAQIGSQQAGQAANFMQNLQNQYLNSVNQRASALTSMYSQQQQMAMQQQNNQMQMLQFEKSMMPTPYQQYEMTPASDKLAGYAGRLFGTGDNSASTALSFLQGLGSHQSANALDFAQFAAQQAQSNPDPTIRSLPQNQLRALAQQMYQTLGVNPNPLNYQNQP